MRDILLESGTNELEVVEFEIDQVEGKQGEELYHGYYAINVAKVREIIKTPENISEMTGSHPCIEGIVEIRGRVIPVINLPKWLGKYDESLPLKRIIITEFNKTTNGFLVHDANRIHRVSWEQVEPPTGLVARESQDCITGVIKFDKKIVLILDFEKIVMDLNPESGFPDEVVGEISEKRKGKSVFIAEDSGMVAKAIKRTLMDAGYDVQWDYNGLACWNRLKQVATEVSETGEPLENKVGLLVSDIEMPQMDGLHLLKKIRENPVLGRLPVILFSSLASEDNIRKWKDLNATEIITKPEMSYLLERVDHYLIN